MIHPLSLQKWFVPLSHVIFGLLFISLILFLPIFFLSFPFLFSFTFSPLFSSPFSYFFSKWHCVESLQSHSILAMSHWSFGLPVCFPSQGTQIQIPRGVLMWNRDSPISIVSLHWWPRCDLSLFWPHLRRALSRTVTRPSCRQCDNPTWSHTAYLSRFHARCRSPFRLHNRRSRLLGRSPVESLQSHSILTMSHWSSGLPVCFPS